MGGNAVIARLRSMGRKDAAGPEVRRYNGQMLSGELGQEFDLLMSVPEIHGDSGGRTAIVSVRPVQACLTDVSDILLAAWLPSRHFGQMAASRASRGPRF